MASCGGSIRRSTHRPRSPFGKKHIRISLNQQPGNRALLIVGGIALTIDDARHAVFANVGIATEPRLAVIGRLFDRNRQQPTLTGARTGATRSGPVRRIHLTGLHPLTRHAQHFGRIEEAMTEASSHRDQKDAGIRPLANSLRRASSETRRSSCAEKFCVLHVQDDNQANPERAQTPELVR